MARKSVNPNAESPEVSAPAPVTQAEVASVSQVVHEPSWRVEDSPEFKAMLREKVEVGLTKEQALTVTRNHFDWLAEQAAKKAKA